MIDGKLVHIWKAAIAYDVVQPSVLPGQVYIVDGRVYVKAVGGMLELEKMSFEDNNAIFDGISVISSGMIKGGSIFDSQSYLEQELNKASAETSVTRKCHMLRMVSRGALKLSDRDSMLDVIDRSWADTAEVISNPSNRVYINLIDAAKGYKMLGGDNLVRSRMAQIMESIYAEFSRLS